MKLWTEAAWLDGRWQSDVLLEVDGGGCWSRVDAGVPQPGDARTLPGPVLPPRVNAHSHAFQRAMAGQAEYREADHDDFWTWREAMYGVALSITPEQQREWATRLYREMLAGGYTQVVEFHYLHHDPDGKPYDDELAMAWSLVEAARDAGIGMTLLPVLYAHQGFSTRGVKPAQRRFASDADFVWRARQRLATQESITLRTGVSLHSLRAAHADDFTALLAQVGDADLPIHIHAAEQVGEVRDCLAATGMRPIEWLCRRQPLDARWHLVHATHATPHEVEMLAARGAGVVLCPGTEGNLGDGVPPLADYLRHGVPLALGGDSHVTRDWREELRWLEYTQRLLQLRRNVNADPPRQSSSAGRLFDAFSGAAAGGFSRWGLQVGARADWLCVDLATEGLEAVPRERWLDALVFASRGPWLAEVGVAGRAVQANAMRSRPAFLAA